MSTGSEQSAEQPGAQEHPMEPDAHAATILVIDDQLANLGVILDALAQRGLTILTAPGGALGLERATHAQPDLILLDVVMPELNGFETCRRLKAAEATREIPVIFMTALDDIDDKVNGFAAGGVDYVIKPVQEQEVLARVQTHVALRRLQRQLVSHIARLQQEIAERQRAEAERERLIGELQTALSNIKTLRGLLPICASCKQIRDDRGYWIQVEVYIRDHSEAEFSHGICPGCLHKLYPELYPDDPS
jgi:DNA-binding response OmpR family regulator